MKGTIKINMEVTKTDSGIRCNGTSSFENVEALNVLRVLALTTKDFIRKTGLDVVDLTYFMVKELVPDED